jgi:hypothetical protein
MNVPQGLQVPKLTFSPLSAFCQFVLVKPNGNSFNILHFEHLLK